MNVKMTIEQIKQKSPILKEMMENQEIGISGAMYHVASGKVHFL
jgi:carbonic anhydrase